MDNFPPFSYTLDTILCAIENPGEFLRGSPDFKRYITFILRVLIRKGVKIFRLTQHISQKNIINYSRKY